jgi:2-polyprenyl-3-methyl-5-hydroxy-6-metoxy-1,4-benzoquinol methylase
MSVLLDSPANILMNCYLCNSTSFTRRKGQVRDAPELQILECIDCGLVTLSALGHIQPGFYEDSGMHGGAERISMEAWLKDTDWDDQRRFDMLKSMLPNKKLLDFGCGAGGFLNKTRQLAESVEGVELEMRVQKYWYEQITIYPSVESAGCAYDLITAFHVLEHLPEPRTMLKILANRLAKNGRLVIEVPSSEDVLLTLYDSEAFQSFTYWSQHLFLFNAETLRRLAEQAGLRIVTIQQFQRYPLSNHLHWLSHGKPGGHHKWAFLDSPELSNAYANALAAMGKCDTLIVHLENGRA